MGTYKGIQGYSVQTLASDPPAAQSVGQLWYNTSSNTWKISIEGAAAWASAPAINTGRDLMMSAGTQTAAIIAGGEPPNTSNTEIYNGSSWTEVNNLVSGGRYSLAGFGSTTAAIASGGYPPTAGANSTESWNGTSWTETNNMNTPRYAFGTAKNSPTTAGMAMGGITSPGHGNETKDTEDWDGTSWSQQNDMLTARAAATGTGIATAAIACGGSPGSGVSTLTDKVEKWNGTSWSEVNNLNTDRMETGTAGTSTLALCFGGRTGEGAYSALNESYDGTSWTEVADLAQGLRGPGGAGSQTAALCAGGSNTGAQTTSYEWNDPVITAQTVTTS